jgi:hypothetical protein
MLWVFLSHAAGDGAKYIVTILVPFENNVERIELIVNNTHEYAVSKIQINQYEIYRPLTMISSNTQSGLGVDEIHLLVTDSSAILHRTAISVEGVDPRYIGLTECVVLLSNIGEINNHVCYTVGRVMEW